MLLKAVRVFVLLKTIYIVLPQISAQQCSTPNLNSYPNYILIRSTYKTLINKAGLGECYDRCINDRYCSSLNYFWDQEKCEHNHGTRLGSPSLFLRRENSVYIEVQGADYGSSNQRPALSCKRIRDVRGLVPSGNYWLQIDQNGVQTPPFQAYCDMKTDGGGWTLVYSYRFTNYASFQSVSNAVNPYPTWPGTDTTVSPNDRSTTVPLNEWSYAAMNFTWWKEIGDEFLIKPNITHWISCQPGTGSLVEYKTGDITCKVVRNIAAKCLNNAPTRVSTHNCGFALWASDLYMYFEGSTTVCWPVHDPCATKTSTNHLTGIGNPGGVVYLR